VPKTAIQAFHITVNSPLLQSASIKNTKVYAGNQWCGYYAGGVSLIFPDVQFGMVSLD